MLKEVVCSFPSCFGDLCPVPGDIVLSEVLGVLLRGEGELKNGMRCGRPSLRMAQGQSPGWHHSKNNILSSLGCFPDAYCVCVGGCC